MFIVERLLSVVAPYECIGCGAEGGLVCVWCKPDFCLPVPSRCFLCRAATVGSAVCAKCRKKTPLHHVWVRAELTGNAQTLLYKFKFECAQAAALDLASLMTEILPYPQDTVIVPVPSATTRVRERGYDHTKLLAKALAKETNVQTMNALYRLGQSRQVGMKRDKRLSQLAGMFWVRDESSVKGRRIWLVDDVVTTGATLHEAAKILKKAGAKTVSAVVFAQK